MRRNMQNLSFLAIIGVLLSCAFFFSQQAKSSRTTPIQQASASVASDTIEPISMDDLPDCSNLENNENRFACYSEAALISQQMVETKVNEVMAIETESQHRMEFMGSQLAWEDSRDKDCEMIQNMSQNEDEAALNQTICLVDHNLSRFFQLESFYCEWYDPSGCDLENWSNRKIIYYKKTNNKQTSSTKDSIRIYPLENGVIPIDA